MHTVARTALPIRLNPSYLASTSVALGSKDTGKPSLINNEIRSDHSPGRDACRQYKQCYIHTWQRASTIEEEGHFVPGSGVTANQYIMLNRGGLTFSFLVLELRSICTLRYDTVTLYAVSYCDRYYACTYVSHGFYLYIPLYQRSLLRQ